MINVKLLVCTLDQAIRLNELGVYQDTLLYYIYYTNSNKNSIHVKKSANDLYSHNLRKYGSDSTIQMCSAYTVSELGVMLSVIGFEQFDVFNVKSLALPDVVFSSGNEADVRAQALIYLIENNLIDIETINNILHETFYISADKY